MLQVSLQSVISIDSRLRNLLGERERNLYERQDHRVCRGSYKYLCWQAPQ